MMQTEDFEERFSWPVGWSTDSTINLNLDVNLTLNNEFIIGLYQNISRKDLISFVKLIKSRIWPILPERQCWLPERKLRAVIIKLYNVYDMARKSKHEK